MFSYEGVEQPTVAQGLLSRTYYPLGFAVALNTNSRELHRIAERVWPSRTDRVRRVPTCSVQVELAPGVMRASELRMCDEGDVKCWLMDDDNFMTVHADSGFAFGRLSEGALEQQTFVSDLLLRPAVMEMLRAHYVTELNATTVVRNGVGFLLTGDAAARAQMVRLLDDTFDAAVLSDPTSFLLRDPERPRVRAQHGPHAGWMQDGMFLPVSSARESQGRNNDPHASCEVEISFVLRLSRDGGPVRPVAMREMLADVIADVATIGDVRALRCLDAASAYEVGFGDARTILRVMDGFARWMTQAETA